MELNAKERRRLKRQAARAAQGPAAVDRAAAKEYAVRGKNIKKE